MRRIHPAFWIAAIVAVPLVLSFLPGLPAHGYGHILLVLPVLYALRHPRQRRRLALYALGLAVQFLAYPEPDLGFLGWVLLWPYLLAREEEDGASWWRAAFLYGFLRAWAGFYWLGNVHFTGWLGVSLLSGLAFAFVFELPLRRLRFVPYALRVAGLWLLFEWVHSVAVGGFPWLFLAHTQYRFLALVQSADLVGAYGISFIVAFVQAAALEAVRARRLTAAAGAGVALLVATLAYGVARRGPEGPDGPGVLMVQSAVPHHVKEQQLASERGPLQLWKALMRLTRDGLRAHPATRLVIWPETMLPFPYVEGGAPPARAYRDATRVFADDFDRPAIYGVNTYASWEEARRDRGYNSAALVDADGDTLGVYRKQRLVPMGEAFTPRRLLPEDTADALFDWLATNLGLPRSCDLRAGEGFVTLDAGDGLRCATLICFEGLYPDLARGAVAHESPDLVLHLVNNGWFGRSYEQRQCVPIWVFRAIETRTPFLSCANAGITCAVSPRGEILGRVDRVMEEGFIHVNVPPRWPPPPYLGGGFLFPLAFLLLALPACLWRARRRGPESR